MSNTKDTNLYTNLCTKITRDNTRDNSGNTRGNDDNTWIMSCPLILNGMDCYTIFNVRFSAQIGTQVSVHSIIVVIYVNINTC